MIDSDLTEIAQQNIFNFALRQRWQTKRGPEGQKHSVDFFRLDCSLSLVDNDQDDSELPGKFFYTAPERQFGNTPLLNTDLVNLGLTRRERINQNLSDHADADWSWRISESTIFTGGINYNLHDGVISQAHSAIALQRSDRLSFYIGNRFLHNGDPFDDGDPPGFRDSHYLTSGASYKLNKKFTLSAAHQFDLDRIDPAYTQAVLIRKFNRFYSAFSISFDPDRETVSFSVSFWPEGFDKFALGTRRFSRLTR